MSKRKGYGNEQDLERARKLLDSNPLVDGHNDLPWTLRTNKARPRSVEGLDERARVPGDTDIPRLREGKVAAQFWSTWVPGEYREGHAKTELEQIDIVHRMIERYPDVFEQALTASDIVSCFDRGKIASLIGVEGGHTLENSLGALRSFYRLGARYLTLTHNVTLDWVDAALDTYVNDGLSPFGHEVILEMNRLGMMVDLSHVSDDTMHDVLDISQAPVIFSHASARVLTDHLRNVPDDVLERIPANGGVVMVTFIPAFVSNAVLEWELPLRERVVGQSVGSEEFLQLRSEFARENPPPSATIEDVADHIDYISEKVGRRHVGIGSDFYGSGNMPDGLEDVSRFPHLFAELVRRGWDDEALVQLAGENIIRVFGEVEKVGQDLRKVRGPSAAIMSVDGGVDTAPEAKNPEN